MIRHCFNCGDAVSPADWDTIGNQKVWCCSEAACQRELNNANRGAQEEAQYEAQRDNYGRY